MLRKFLLPGLVTGGVRALSGGEASGQASGRGDGPHFWNNCGTSFEGQHSARGRLARERVSRAALHSSAGSLSETAVLFSQVYFSLATLLFVGTNFMNLTVYPLLRRMLRTGHLSSSGLQDVFSFWRYTDKPPAKHKQYSRVFRIIQLPAAVLKSWDLVQMNLSLAQAQHSVGRLACFEFRAVYLPPAVKRKHVTLLNSERWPMSTWSLLSWQANVGTGSEPIYMPMLFIGLSQYRPH